jgi:hypothetical protein
MALTLTEGNKYSITNIKGYVIDRLGKDSEILAHLPFEEILGNSLTYDTVTTRSGAAFYEVGDTWTESTPSLTQATAVLRILGGDADVDNFLLKTRSNHIDLKGTVLEDKIKAVREKYLDTFYYGSNSSNAKEFDGMHTLMTSTTYNTVHAGSGTGTALSIAKLQQAIDLITGWKPTHIAMSKALRRGINVYLDSIGDKFVTTRDDYGHMIEHFRGLKVIVDDHIVDVETAASGAYSASSGGANTSLFIFSFAPKAACGIHSGDQVMTEPLGSLETKDATRWRIKWYCGLKLEDLRSCSKVDGIVSAGTVTA